MTRHSQGEAQRRRAEEPSRSASACMGGAGLFGGASPLTPSVCSRVPTVTGALGPLPASWPLTRTGTAGAA
jgi:hypothetical protein